MSRFKIFRWVGKFISLSIVRKVLEFLKNYFGGLLKRLDEHHVFLAAGGIAYSLLLSMIPILLLMFSIFGSIINVESIEQQVNTIIDALIPYKQSAAYMKKFILSRVPEVIEYKTLAGILGALGLFFTATWLFSSLRTVLNNIFGDINGKSAWIALLRDFGMVLLVIIFILLSTVGLPILNILVDSADNVELLRYFRISDLLEWLLSFISVLIIFILFFGFYYLIPYEKLGRRVPIVSAFWATFLWELARMIFEYYVQNFLVINKIYGAFVLIAVVAFWIFYSSIVFIIGAEIGQLYRERKLLKEKL